MITIVRYLRELIVPPGNLRLARRKIPAQIVSAGDGKTGYDFRHAISGSIPVSERGSW
jgi:hypothetical protein